MDLNKYHIDLVNKKVSSFVYTGTINSYLDLYTIYENLDIDEIFLGMKFNNNYKGNIKKTKCMFNHITLNCVVYGKNINIKFSKTGSFQVTGIKYISQIYYIVDTFIERIKNINGMKIIKTINLCGFLCDYSDYKKFGLLPRNRFNNIRIYSSKGKLIGYKNGQTFYINNVELKKDEEFGIFYEVKRNSLTRAVYNTEGEVIGELCFINHIKKDGKRLPLFNKFTIEKKDDYYIYNKLYKYNGVVITTLTFSKHLKLNKDIGICRSVPDHILDIDFSYSCLDKVSSYHINNLKLVNANITLCFDVQENYYVDKIKCIKKIESLGYYADDNKTSKYPVISIKIYTDLDYNTTTKENNDKCFSISYYYLTNKAIISNATSKENIYFIENLFKKLLNDIKEDVFIKKKKINENCEKISLRTLL